MTWLRLAGDRWVRTDSIVGFALDGAPRWNITVYVSTRYIWTLRANRLTKEARQFFVNAGVPAEVFLEADTAGDEEASISRW